MTENLEKFNKVIEAVTNGRKGEKALAWYKEIENSPTLTRPESACALIRVRAEVLYGSACLGASEMNRYLALASADLTQEILTRAISYAKADIELALKNVK